MHPIVTVLLILLALFCLWLFLVHGKRAPKEKIAPFLRPYAHRGLYGDGIPENSIPAFLRAAEQGFAIELDVQLSADGEVMVFHDYTLDRVCGVSAKLSETSSEVLQKTSLEGTEHCIPTLRQVLSAVDGKVPLLIELKGESTSTALCPPVAEILDSYKGEWCVESFNPILLRWFKKNRGDAVRGLLTTCYVREKHGGDRFLRHLLTAELLNVLARPMFIAWDHRYQNSPTLRFNLKTGLASFVYTIREREEYDTILKKGGYPIFERFVPEGNGQ